MSAPNLSGTTAGGGSSPSGSTNWRRDISLFMGYTVNQGTWIINQTATPMIFGRIYNSTAVQNDAISYGIGLDAGTWTLNMMGETFTNRGIITVALDGTSVGTIDQYAGADVPNTVFNLPNITVPSTGQHALKFTAATKNASSSGYQIAMQWITLVRTA